MTAVYRHSILQVARVFRTVSYYAVCFFADMMTIHLLAEERTESHRPQSNIPETEGRKIVIEAKTEMTGQWQKLW